MLHPISFKTTSMLKPQGKYYLNTVNHTKSSKIHVKVINTLRLIQNSRHFTDVIFKCLFFVSRGQINNVPVLVQIMASCQPGNMPLSEPMMAILLTHICITQPQWFNSNNYARNIRNTEHGYTQTYGHPADISIPAGWTQNINTRINLMLLLLWNF